MHRCSRGIALQIAGARGQVRDVLQADGLAEKTDSATGPAGWTVCSATWRPGDFAAPRHLISARKPAERMALLTRPAAVDLDQGTPSGRGPPSAERHQRQSGRDPCPNPL